MGETTDWKLKVKVDCPECKGTGGEYDNHYEPCVSCKGTGKIVQEVEPKDIEAFSNRPPSKEFKCVCGNKEIILRPRLDQLPNGWVHWSGHILCLRCRNAVLQAALIAAADKVEQLKEKYDE